MAEKVKKPTIKKAFAVRSKPPLKRKEAVSPLSVDWRLYKPDEFIEALFSYVQLQDGATKEDVMALMESNGISKAFRQREELIKWKVRLHNELKERQYREKELLFELHKNRAMMRRVQDSLVGIRNVLRIPREETPGAKKKTNVL